MFRRVILFPYNAQRSFSQSNSKVNVMLSVPFVPEYAEPVVINFRSSSTPSSSTFLLFLLLLLIFYFRCRSTLSQTQQRVFDTPFDLIYQYLSFLQSISLLL